MADKTRGIAALVTVIGIFLPWYGVRLGFVSVHASGVSVHGWLYLVFLVGLAVVADAATRAGGVSVPVRLPYAREAMLFAASTFDLVLVAVAFLDKPGGPVVGWSWGAVVTLLAAIVAEGNSLRRPSRG